MSWNLDQPFDPAGWFGAAQSTSERELASKIAEHLSQHHGSARVSSSQPFSAMAESFPAAPMPEAPLEPAHYLEQLCSRLVPHSFNTAAPRYLGHMTAGVPGFARPFTQLMVSLHQNPVKVETAKSATALEREVLGQLHREVFGQRAAFYQEHVHDRESTLGMLCSGGTAANLTALWIARNLALGPQAEHAGLASALIDQGYRRAVVIGSSLLHYSFDKAADVLGIGRQQLLRLPADRHGRISAEAARRAVLEERARGSLVLALVGVAGTTDCGSIDPLESLADVAEQTQVHFHVDAAWAGPLLLSRQHRSKLAGAERADSLTLDGHKQLYLPMGLGVLLLRKPTAAVAIEKQAAYIIRAASPDLGRRSLEGSRPANSILLHAGMHLLGRSGYGELVDRGVALARAFAAEVAARPGFELLMEPQCNIVVYRLARAGSDEVERDELTQRVQEQQRDRGRGFVSRTTLSHLGGPPVVALRAVLANPLTTLADVRAVLDEQAELAGLT